MDYDTLVLPGGGIKGFNLLGAIQALMDVNICGNVKTYIGTSIGSIISYLLAINYTPIEILVAIYTHQWMDKVKHFNLVDMINGSGAISFASIYEVLEKLTIDKIGYFLTLGKLKEKFGKTLICVTYNMTTCVTEYLGPENHPDLPCITALRMSCNIPLIFERFKYMDNFYVDGGISDNFAILKGEEIGQKILGLNLQISKRSLQDEPEDGMIAYFARLLYTPIAQATKYKIATVGPKCTIIDIEGGETGHWLEFNATSKVRLEMFSIGYNSVKKYLEQKNTPDIPVISNTVSIN